MKKILQFTVVTALCLSGATIVNAQNETPLRVQLERANLGEENVKVRINEAQERLEITRDQVREQVQERVRDQIQNQIQVREEKRINLQEERGREIQTRIEERSQAIEEKVEERRQLANERRLHLSEQAKERIKNLATQMLNRFYAATERLENIAHRIQSRLDILSERGIDISLTQRHLNDAVEKIDDAKAEIAAVRNSVGEILDGEISKEIINGLFGPAKDAIIAARDALNETLRVFKASISISADDSSADTDDDSDSSDVTN